MLATMAVSLFADGDGSADHTSWIAVVFSAVALLGAIAREIISALKERWAKQNDKDIAVKTALLEARVTTQATEIAACKDAHKAAEEKGKVIEEKFKECSEQHEAANKDRNAMKVELANAKERLEKIETVVVVPAPEKKTE